MRRIAIVAWLTVFWVILWGDLGAGTALAGLGAAVALTTSFPPELRERPEHTLRPHWAIAFAAYFGWKLLEANVVLAIEILTPRDSIRSGIISVSTEGSSELVTTLVANAFTLTPGTLTLEVRQVPPTLFVHVLHLRDTESVRRDVRRLQYLALRAIGSRESLRRHREATRTDEGRIDA